MTLGEKLKNKSNNDTMYNCTVMQLCRNNCRERNCRNKLNANDPFSSNMKHQGLCIHFSNIAKIANDVQVSLLLSVTNPHCHDKSFLSPHCHQAEVSVSPHCHLADFPQFVRIEKVPSKVRRKPKSGEKSRSAPIHLVLSFYAPYAVWGDRLPVG